MNDVNENNIVAAAGGGEPSIDSFMQQALRKSAVRNFYRF
jgi:hypothetical protein